MSSIQTIGIALFHGPDTRVHVQKVHGLLRTWFAGRACFWIVRRGFWWCGWPGRLLLRLLRRRQLLRHRVRQQHLAAQRCLSSEQQPEALRTSAAEQEEDDAVRGVEYLPETGEVRGDCGGGKLWRVMFSWGVRLSLQCAAGRSCSWEVSR